MDSMDAQRVVLRDRLRRILDGTPPDRLHGALLEWAAEVMIEAYATGFRRGREAGWKADYDVGGQFGRGMNQ